MDAESLSITTEFFICADNICLFSVQLGKTYYKSSLLFSVQLGKTFYNLHFCFLFKLEIFGSTWKTTRTENHSSRKKILLRIMYLMRFFYLFLE